MKKQTQTWERHHGKEAAFWFRAMLALALLLGLLGPAATPAHAAEVPVTAPAVGRAGPDLPPAGIEQATAKKLIPVGRAVGIKLFSDGVLVVGFSQVPAAGGSVIPAKTCGLREGDVITHINSAEVDTIEEVQAQLAAIGGEKMSIRALRGKEEVQVTAQAVKCSTDGCYKLGAWLRDSMAGIGTVTWYDPETGCFGALGHGINDVDTALLMPLESGGVLTAHVSDVKKGKRNEPGELHGTFELDRDVGALSANTPHGIFGTLDRDTWAASGLPQPVEVARPDQIRTGKATILSNIAGDEVKSYEVEITKLLPGSPDGRDMMLRVTDPALLAGTGGIVQGMVLRYNKDNTGKSLRRKGFRRFLTLHRQGW